jgi:signal transduction histidine kinase/DNA-binding NarL/FixJ family response regulator
MLLLSPRFYTRLITIWIALSVGGIVMGAILWKRLNASLESTMANAAFRQQVDTVYTLLNEAEAGQRGYLLTKDPTYLAPYAKAEAEFDNQLDALARMTFNDDVLRKQVLDLRGLADLRRREMERAITLRNESGLEAAVKIVQTNRGKTYMDRIRAILAGMQRGPNDLFYVHGQETRDAMQRTLLTTLGSAIVGLGAGLIAFYISRVALKQEQDARILAEQNLNASRAVREKSAFLANMSHEIRTPMNAILGFGDLLAAELPSNSKSRGYARAIRDSATSLLQLINDILDLSKIEAGMIELHPEPTAMREVADFLQTIFAQQVAAKGLRMEFELEPTLPQALLLDRSRLRQILVNLLGNAVKFTEQGLIRVRLGFEVDGARRDRGTLLLEVRDTGVGIPPERLKEIFEPFVQVNPAPADATQGTGLGLSIVKRLIQRMGGTVALESVVGQGSAFFLRFPEVAISARLPVVARTEEEDQVDFNRLAPIDLLVVDDNAINRELLAGYFSGTHHRVIYASDGLEAVESVSRCLPDIILMDIRMPRMDGRQALEEIRKLPGAEILPIIAVTASSMLDDEFVLRGVFAGFIRKPFTRQALFRELSAFVRRASSEADPSARGVVVNLRHSDAALRNWGALVRDLRQLEETAWPAVRESGAINETKEFAQRLAEMGRDAGCPPLVSYAESLLGDAEGFAVARLASRLNDFPGLVQSLSGGVPASSLP